MRILSLAALALIAFGCGGKDSGSTTPADTGSAAADTAAPAATATYDGGVKAVFAEYCTPCHVTGKSGGHSIGASYADSQKDSGVCTGKKIGQCALERIKSGEMPKGGGCTGDPTKDAADKACLPQADVDLIQKWVDAGMPEK